MYVQRSSEARSDNNHYYRGKSISVTYSECVFVALVKQNAMRLRHIVIIHQWPVRIYNIFPHFLTNGTIIENKNY
jgi:hypothetical protein